MIRSSPPADPVAQVAVVIVNWNSGPQLRACLDSVSRTVAHSVVVVDNASCDGSELAAADAPGVMLVRAGGNLGFAKACNLGAQHAAGDYLLFLNPDAALFPGTLEKALAFMEDPDNSGYGICGVQLVDERGRIARTCVRFPSAWSFVIHALGVDRLMPRLGYFMAEWPHDASRSVDHVIGAFFLVRRSVFQSLKGFDERFFVYLEDLDFSLRAAQAGWRSAYLADIQAFHLGGGTSHQVKARRLFYSLRSRIIYARKHFGAPGAAMVVAATMFLEPVSRGVLAVAKRSGSALRETFQGYAMLWQWLPNWWRKGNGH